MRAVRFHRHGPPAEVLQLDDLETPEPGPGEVRLRITHRPVHPSDLGAVRGTYGALRALPAVAGNEGAGTVEAVGPGVAAVRVGQRAVKLGPWPTWQEAVVLPEADVWALPDDLDVSDEDAAQLFVNPLTARLLLDAADLAPGAVAVQTAGASTVARIVTALAARAGVATVNVVRSDEHADALRALGAAVAVAEADTPDAREALRAAVAAAGAADGAAAVFDAVAGPTGTLALAALAAGGRHVVYGGLSREPLAVTSADLIYRRITVTGVWRSDWVTRVPREAVVSRLDALARDAAAGVFALPVEARFDLADARAAAEAAAARGRWGKVLLVG